MGFRSCFITNDCAIEWPQWLREKYRSFLVDPDVGSSVLASRHEYKLYLEPVCDLAEDVRKALSELRWVGTVVVVFLHECGGLTKADIDVERVLWMEPGSWDKVTEGGTHSYCYGCSSEPRSEMRQEILSLEMAVSKAERILKEIQGLSDPANFCPDTLHERAASELRIAMQAIHEKSVRMF